MKVGQIMSTPPVVVREDATLEEAARIMLKNRFSGLPVVDAAGRAVGFITESDFMAKERGVPFSMFAAPALFGRWLGKEGVERLYEEARDIQVKTVMSPRVVSLPESATIEQVLGLLSKEDINRIVIVHEERPVGIVSRHDVLRLMAR